TSGSAGPAGEINLSADGHYLTFAGYDVNFPSGTGTTNLKGRSDVPRNIGRIDGNGNLDTSTALNDFAFTNTPSGAVSVHGQEYYAFSSQIDSVRYAPLGASHSTELGPTDRKSVV